MAVRQYSDLFHCIYDQSEPYGNIGRGCHYSVMRCAEWRDVQLTALEFPELHNFAVIWDEDHDTRIINVLENMYMAGLLSPVQFVGECRGHLTVVVASRSVYNDRFTMEEYKREIEKFTREVGWDNWFVEIGTYDRNNILKSGRERLQTDLAGIIGDDGEKDSVYLRNIDYLWNLGTYPFQRRVLHVPNFTPPPIPVFPKP